MTSPRGELIETQGVVALLDALGTKGILATRSPQVVFDDWEVALSRFDEACAIAREESVCDDCQLMTISDTMVITMRGPSAEPLLSLMGEVLLNPFYEALKLGVYFRGVVSVGRYFQAQTKIFGPAIDEAAEWYEQSDWIGISATPSMQRYLELFEYSGVDVSRYFVRYEIPYADRPRSGWALCWPQFGAEVDRDFRMHVLRSFADRAGSVGLRPASKYANTIAFLDWARER